MDFLKYPMHESLQLQTKEEMETASELATMGSCGGRLAAFFPPTAAEISAQHIKIVYIYHFLFFPPTAAEISAQHIKIVYIYTLLIFLQKQYGEKDFYTLYYTLYLIPYTVLYTFYSFISIRAQFCYSRFSGQRKIFLLLFCCCYSFVQADSEEIRCKIILATCPSDQGCGSGSVGSKCFWASRIQIHKSEIRLRIRFLLSSSKNS